MGKFIIKQQPNPPKIRDRAGHRARPLGWAPRSRTRSHSTCWHRDGCKGHSVSGDTWASPGLLAPAQGAAKVLPPQPQAGHPGSITAAVGSSPCLPRPHSRLSPAGGAAGARGCHRPIPTCSRVGARDQGCGAGSWEAPHARGRGLGERARRRGAVHIWISHACVQRPSSTRWQK